MKKNIIKLIFVVLLFAATLGLASCSAPYVPYAEIYATLPPYAESAGATTCSHSTKEVFSRDGESIRACTLCGYGDSKTHYYHTYDQMDGGMLGRYDTVIVKLNAEYNEKTVSVRSGINEVIFVGTEGQTLNNLKIKIEPRLSELTVSLSNVRITSDYTIIDAASCEQKITLKTYGADNNLTTKTGKAGEDGTLATIVKNYTYQYYANSGTDGADAQDVISVGGNIDVYAYAPLAVNGGNGGMGGRGASHRSESIAYGIANGGGNGGKGGNGADAISFVGVLNVAEGRENLTLTAGKGGSGGSGGSRYTGSGSSFYNYTDGYRGSDGTDGKTGLAE